jgi:DNA-binding beta-propeller fold protein YncE
MNVLHSLLCRASAVFSLIGIAACPQLHADLADGRYLYVATPGIRNYLEYGGHGLVVFDIDNDYKFVKRIATAGLNKNGMPENVKGVCASAETGLLHIATLTTLTCIDVASEKVLWEKPYEGGCDRMGIAPDGSYLYLPSLEKGHWHVVKAENGEVLAKIEPKSRAHNTIVGRNGTEAYLAGLGSPLLTIADTIKHTAARKVGPFSGNIRPFTVNGDQTRVYANVNGLLGFEIGNLTDGKVIGAVKVEGFEKGSVKRHGCPSHGIAVTPDGSEVWLSDGHNSRVHVFKMDGDGAKQVASIPVRDQPGWITMQLDGKHAWPSSGEVVDVKSRKIVATLTDEEGRAVGSEKMVEVHWKDGVPVLCGDQFGYGREP